MKSFLIPIHPEWVAKILNGEKTIEIRRTAPKEWKDYLSGKTKVKPEPMTGYIYCTKDKRHLLRRFPGFYLKQQGRRYQIRNRLCFSNPPILNGKVVAKFTLREVEELVLDHFGYYAVKVSDRLLIDQECWIHKTCTTNVDLVEYLKGKVGYAWHISDLVIFDEPKELSEFRRHKRFVCYNADFDYTTIEYGQIRLTKAPQSWCYVEAKEL